MGDEGLVVEMLLVGTLILVNAFFAGAEIAVLSTSRGRIEERAARGDGRALALLRLKSDPDRFLATVQIGVTLVGTLASAVGGVAAVERLEPVLASLPFAHAHRIAEPVAVAAVVFLIAYLSLVVGELVPKSLAVRHSEALALAAARPVEAFSRFSALAVRALTASSDLILRLLGRKDVPSGHFLSIEDLESIVREAGHQGLIQPDLVQGALAFHDRQVREIMTPRHRVVAVPIAMDLREAARIASESGHSRLPVYREDLDDAVGLVYTRDLFEACMAGTTGRLEAFVREAIVVPHSRRATALLQEMRRTHQPLALVVDEHGSVDGIVTLEDMIEVIVGEIPDEHGAEPLVVRAADGALEADGSVPVHEINDEWGLSLPESRSYVTLAGLVLDRLRALPAGGERVEVPGARLTVLALRGPRVSRVRILPDPPDLEEGRQRPSGPPGGPRR